MREDGKERREVRVMGGRELLESVLARALALAKGFILEA